MRRQSASNGRERMRRQRASNGREQIRRERARGEWAWTWTSARQPARRPALLNHSLVNKEALIGHRA